MYGVELYAAVRLAVVDEGLSHHEAGRRFGIDRRTVKKMLSYSAPPGYRRTKPVRRPKLDGFTGIVDAILEADTDPDVPRKQRHTAHRIFERLRDEHGFSGGYTIVKDYVRSRRQSTREAFVPLHHPPGHAQVDFGEATVEVGGRREKVAFFCLILPHSNVWFVKAYPRETTEAFLDGHVSAFAFLGGVPRSILYDNTTLAVARILGDGTRRRTQAFAHLQSHYLFRDRFGRPGCQRRLKIRPKGGAKDCHLGWWSDLGVRLGVGDAVRGFFGGSGQRSHAELKRSAPAGRPQGGMVYRVGVGLATRALGARCRPGPSDGVPQFSYRHCFCGRGFG